MVDALVLAGSLNDGPLRDCSPARFEALIPIGGKAMVLYVLDALKASRHVDRIVLVGPSVELTPVAAGPGIIIADSAGGIMDNIEAGLSQMPAARRVLLATSDIPLLTGQAVDDFIAQCGGMEADMYYPVIRRDVVEKRFPNTRRTYVTFKEGTFTGGNLFLFNPAVFKRCAENGQKIIAQRKNPLGLCRLLGAGFVIKYLFHLLTILDAEEKVSQLLGIAGKVNISRYPEVGVDVDKPGDLELVKGAMTANRL